MISLILLNPVRSVWSVPSIFEAVLDLHNTLQDKISWKIHRQSTLMDVFGQLLMKINTPFIIWKYSEFHREPESTRKLVIVNVNTKHT